MHRSNNCNSPLTPLSSNSSLLSRIGAKDILFGLIHWRKYDRLYTAIENMLHHDAREVQSLSLYLLFSYNLSYLTTSSLILLPLFSYNLFSYLITSLISASLLFSHILFSYLITSLISSYNRLDWTLLGRIIFIKIKFMEVVISRNVGPKLTVQTAENFNFKFEHVSMR